MESKRLFHWEPCFLFCVNKFSSNELGKHYWLVFCGKKHTHTHIRRHTRISASASEVGNHKYLYEFDASNVVGWLMVDGKTIGQSNATSGLSLICDTHTYTLSGSLNS